MVAVGLHVQQLEELLDGCLGIAGVFGEDVLDESVQLLVH